MWLPMDVTAMALDVRIGVRESNMALYPWRVSSTPDRTLLP